MKHNITEIDKTTLEQQDLDVVYKLFLTNDEGTILEEVNDIISIGQYNIDGNSDLRTSLSVTIQFNDKLDTIEEKISSWLRLNFKLEISLYNIRLNKYICYECGTYVMTNPTTSYDANTNSISLSLGDWTYKLNGTRNGQIGGAPTILIPSIYDKDNDKKNTLQSAMTLAITEQGGIKKYIIENLGTFYGMEENNDNYIEYREKNPDWNVLPHDLNFNAGCTVYDIVEEIKNIYPNCQIYFDRYNNFCFNMIPSRLNSPISLSNEYIQSILLADNSESVSYNIESIKNVTEVFGKSYDIDRLSEICVTTSNVYIISLTEYNEYKNYDYIAFTPNTNNILNMRLKVNSLVDIPIYYENTTTSIDINTMLSDEIYVVHIRKIDGHFIAYYLGQYQPHALCVLSNNKDDDKYTLEYFQKKYNCNNVTLRIEEDSPFAVQKLGEILDVKEGKEFEDIISDYVAKENAIYQNRISSSFCDNITISTVLIPFLDVYEKIEYKKQQEDVAHEYIIQSISNTTTSSITMYRFYPLYYID